MQIDIQSYKDLGQALREVRSSMQLDPRDVAQQLHIRAKYLTALEDGDIEVMPGKVYARGYLRQYAEFLGLNADEVTEAFDKVGTGQRHVKYFVPEPTSRNYQPGVLLVVIALAAVALVYLYWYRANNHNILPPDHEMVAPVPERLLNPVAVGPQPEDGSEAIDGNAFIGPQPLPAEEEAPAEPVVDTPLAEPTPHRVPAPHVPQKPVSDTPWLEQTPKAKTPQ